MTACLKSDLPGVLLTFLHQANIVGRLAAWRARVPVVVSGVRVADRRWSVAITERLTRGLVTAWTAVSDSVAITHCRSCGIDRRHMHTIFNGVDVPAIDDVVAASRGKSGLSSEHFVVLVAGRLTSQKAPGDVLQALALWRDMDPEAFDRVQLVYAGDGPQRPALGRAAMGLKLYDRVQFPGVRTDLPALMKASDVLVLASRWEGLPNVVLEAMAAQLPVIASAVDGTCELVTDGQTGRLYPAGDVSRLAELLAVARRSPESSATMAVAARALVEAKFRWDVCIAAYDELLRRSWSDANEPRS
jgi:glycosyltransferase involved in cell wall biosynthesis